MGREEQIISERLRKLNEIRNKKINPYPEKFEKKQNCSECSNSKIGRKVKTAGRIMSKRDLGRITFSVLKDFSGKIQIVFQEGKTPDKEIEFFKKYIDSGDFLGIEGKNNKDKDRRTFILVERIELLSKSISPLPEKWKGIQDEEEKFRKRYLDILMNPEIKRDVYKKIKILESYKRFFA